MSENEVGSGDMDDIGPGVLLRQWLLFDAQVEVMEVDLPDDDDVAFCSEGAVHCSALAWPEAAHSSSERQGATCQ